MGAEPFASGDPAMVTDLPDDLFGTVGSGPGEADFWTEADRKRRGGRAGAGRTRRHRMPATHAATATATPSVTARPKRTWRGRLAAAWAAESSARRALRYQPEGTPKQPGKGRKVVAGVVAVAALIAAGVAVADLLDHDGTSDRDTELQSAAGLAPGSDGADETDAADRDDAAVESEIVTATTSPRRTKAPTKAASTPTVTPATPKAATPAGSSGSSSSGSSSGSPSPKPTTPTGSNPVVPTTAAPRPVTPTTAVPTTAAPPARPSVQSFTAKAATSPGGACAALQWATTLTWTTTSATSVSITGLLEQPLSSLPGDGTKTVCRALPGGPLGGWTLTATGPGGNTTATA